MSAVLPVDGAVDHAAHFAEPELSDLTALLAAAGRPMRFRIFERDFQLFFHMPSNLRGWVGHMLSKGSLFFWGVLTPKKRAERSRAAAY